MLNSVATNTNCIVLGLTRPGLEPTIYRTRGEHANHYATDAIQFIMMFKCQQSSHLGPDKGETHLYSNEDPFSRLLM